MLKITTNNHYRPLLYWEELTEKEKNELKDDYDTIEESTFFRYKDWVYDLNDFMILNDDSTLSKDWDGSKGESYFSGMLIKLSNCGDAVKVGSYYEVSDYCSNIKN